MGQKWAQKIQLGRETVAGTAVAATAVWRGVGGMLKDDREVTMVEERVGYAQPILRSYIGKVTGSLSMEATPATFEQLPHILEAGIKTVGTGAADGAGSGKIYAYTAPTTAVNTIKTYTIETGDNTQVEEMAYCFVEKFTIGGKRGEAVMMEADWIGREVANSTFTGSLAVPTVDEIITGAGQLFIDANSGTIGTTAITGTLLEWELSVTTGWRGKWTVDAGQLYFNFHYFDLDSYEAELSMTFEHDATLVAEKAFLRSNTSRLIRIKLTGPATATAGTAHSAKTLMLDMPTIYTEFDALDSEDGNGIVKITGTVGYDPTDGTGLAITVVNELSAIS